ncbi:MAG: aminopeptidase P family protein [Candidatus Riflebacteria bacterium]|nr:aminopeptidase P family protein [Candidatus Riflebacteria bacterium]
MATTKIIDRPDYKKRQQKVLSLDTDSFDGLWITGSSNVQYLTGFTGSSGTLFLSKKEAVFFTDFRYEEQSKHEVGDSAKITVFKISQKEAFLEFLKSHSYKKIGIEGSLSVEMFEALKKGSEGKFTFGISQSLVESVRKIKDDYEIQCLHKAFEIADKAFDKLLKFIRPGRKEKEIAAKLEYLLATLGSEKTSFDTIVASGERASCPHAKPTDKKACEGEMIKIDFGAVYLGYHSDMTRTIFLGKPDAKFRKIYNTVLEAQQKAVKALKPGLKGIDIDKVARDHIKNEGFGDYFGHGLGHALGLDVHELPALSFKCPETISAGNVVTVEPGIYIPGWGGVRIEDVYIVQEKSNIKLTSTPNKLLSL